MFTYLMLQNKIVLKTDVDKGIYEVIDENLLPYSLRGAFRKEKPEMSTEQIVNIRYKNASAFTEYLANRILNLSRSNAKKILNALNYSQNQDTKTKAMIALKCNAISATDDYWVKNENSNLNWEDIDIRKNHLNEIVTNIALTGKSLTISGVPHTPELTGQGAYAKAWKRENNKLFLLKKSSKGGQESEIEVSVSKILDCFNVSHVKYELSTYEDSTVCKCENMCNEKYSIVSAEEVYVYCNRHNLNFLNEVLQIDAENVYKTCIVDYLISNSDRHMLNWGFYRSNDTGDLLGCHPLFDHNNAFDETLMKQDGQNMIFLTGMEKTAIEALHKCDFACTKPVTKDMFLNEEMYLSFMHKAVKLGLYQEQKKTFRQRLGLEKYEQFVPIEIVSPIKQETIEDKYKANLEKHANSKIDSEPRPIQNNSTPEQKQVIKNMVKMETNVLEEDELER